MANSQDSLEYRNVQGDPNENRIKDRVFTGWFDFETRAQAKRMKYVEVSILKSKLLYQRIDTSSGDLHERQMRFFGFPDYG
nr:cellulose synthase [Tanacetum cinerariifolium]